MVQDLSFPSNIGLFLTVSRDYSVQYSLLKNWGMAPAKGRASRFPRQALRFENEESAPFPNLSAGDLERSSWVAQLATAARSSVMKMPGQK